MRAWTASAPRAGPRASPGRSRDGPAAFARSPVSASPSPASWAALVPGRGSASERGAPPRDRGLNRRLSELLSLQDCPTSSPFLERTALRRLRFAGTVLEPRRVLAWPVDGMAATPRRCVVAAAMGTLAASKDRAVARDDPASSPIADRREARLVRTRRGPTRLLRSRADSGAPCRSAYATAHSRHAARGRPAAPAASRPRHPVALHDSHARGVVLANARSSSSAPGQGGVGNGSTR